MSTTNVPAPAQVATRTRRKPMLIAAAIVVLVVAALLGRVAYTSINHTESVVALRDTVTRGEVIEAKDLTTAQVAADPNVRTVPAGDTSAVGKRAAFDLVAGTTLTPDSTTESLVPRKERSIVGALLKPGMGPAGGLEPGTPVRLIVVADPSNTSTGSAANGQQQDAPAPDPVPGTVIASSDAPDGSGVRLDVEVAQSDSAALQSAASQSRLAAVIDSKER